jgi:FkbM family methyltransferase
MNLNAETVESIRKAGTETPGLPLVSVLMPAYNHERFVEQAVRSVWEQSYKNIELIVIDDGSSDGTLKILRELDSISPISMQVHTQANQGICRTLNKCFAISNGVWVAHLASDDQYRENFIERMVNESNVHPHDLTVLHCDAIGIDERGRESYRLSKIRNVPPLDGDAFFSIVYGRAFIVSSTMFLSRHLMEKVGPYDENLKAEDFDIHLRLSRLARFVFLNEPLFLARNVEGSLGSRRRVWSDDIFTALAKHESVIGPEYEQIITNRHKRLAIACYSDLDFKGASHHLRRALESTSLVLGILTLTQIVAIFACHTPRALLVAFLPEGGVLYARRFKHRVISLTTAEDSRSFFRHFSKKLPRPVRRFLGYCWDYSTRVLRWHTILRKIRGRTMRDQLLLIASGTAGPITSLRRRGKWQDPVLLWDVAVRVEGIGSFLLRRHTDDLWHVIPSRERTILSTIQKYLKPGGVFVDAGANIGVYTVLAGRLVGESGRVIAVEMMPETAAILRRHIAMNDLENASVVEQALADTTGKHVIARVPAGQNGQASIASGTLKDRIEVRVETTTVSEMLADIDEVDLMKMDLGGAEELALIGAGEVLTSVRAVIFEDWGGSRLSAIFRAKGFSVERLDGNNCLAKNLSAT